MLSRENCMQRNINNVLGNAHSFQYLLFPTLVCDDEKILLLENALGNIIG